MLGEAFTVVITGVAPLIVVLHTVAVTELATPGIFDGVKTTVVDPEAFEN